MYVLRLPDLEELGGAVPDVDVTVTNTATGITRQVMTDQSGVYRVVSLLPGSYKVSAGHPGFSTAHSDAIEVIAGQTLTMNLTLQVGTTTQTIEVTAAAPLLDTQIVRLGLW